MKITPLRDLVLVELLDAPQPEAGGLLIVRSDKPPSTYGRVLACGPDVRETRVGAHVVISRLQGMEIDGKVLLPESAILAEEPSDADTTGS